MEYVTEVRYLILTYLYALWSRRYFVLIILLSFPILGLILYLHAPNKYEASVSLATYDLSSDFIKNMPTVPNLEEQFSGLKAYISSPFVLKKVAEQSGLIKDNDSNNQIHGVVQYLSKYISVTLIDKNTVEIKLTGNNQLKLIDTVNKLSANFIKEYLKPIINSAQSMTIIFKRESEEQKNKLEESIRQLNSFRADHNSSNLEVETIYREQLKSTLVSLEENEKKYQEALAETVFLERSFSTNNSEINSLDKEISDNEANLNKMRLIYNDKYRDVKEAEQISLTLKKERENLLRNHLSNEKTNTVNPDEYLIPTKLDSLSPTQQNQYLNLQKKLNVLKEQIKDLNQQKNIMLKKLKQIDEIKNEETVFVAAVNNNQETYKDLLNKYNEAKRVSQLDFANQFKVIKVMAYPLPPLLDVGHSLWLYLLLATFNGIILSIGLAIILDQMDNTARKRKTLESLAQLPVLTRIGKITS